MGQPQQLPAHGVGRAHEAAHALGVILLRLGVHRPLLGGELAEHLPVGFLGSREVFGNDGPALADAHGLADLGQALALVPDQPAQLIGDGLRVVILQRAAQSRAKRSGGSRAFLRSDAAQSDDNSIWN
jgi:hypothetical protein